MRTKIFNFKDRPALKIQSDSDCAQLYDHFYSTVEDDVRSHFGSCKDELSSVVASLKHLKESVGVTWMAPYGCAIMVKNLDVLSTKISVVGLDKWEGMIHSSVSGREATAIPDVVRPCILEIGPVKNESCPAVMGIFLRLMQSAQSTATREKHHKTPSFVWARLLDAMVEAKALPKSTVNAIIESYQGGMTDVGRHTSCLERNTSFPLVASVYSSMLYLYELDEDHDSFRKMLCVYFLRHLRNIRGNVTTFDQRKIDRGIVVIREVERYIVKVKCKRFQERVIEELEEHHHALKALSPVLDPTMCTTPQDFSIEIIQDPSAAVKPPSLPKVSIRTTYTDYGTRMARAQAQAKTNLQWSDLMVTRFVGKTGTQDDLVALGRINKEFWCYAGDLLDPWKSHDVHDLKGKMETHMQATSLALQKSKGCVSLMTVELRSCQVLVIWITYCWAHRIAKERYPVFSGYSAIFDPDDLGYLVLQEADAIDALKNVKSFLTLHRLSAKVPFCNPSDTLDLALSMGNASNDWGARVRSIHDAEFCAAERRIEERWEKIQKTQAELGVLDSQLKKAESTLRSAEAALSTSRSRDYTTSIYGRIFYTSTYHQYECARNEAIRLVDDLKGKVRRLEARPPDVFFALPKTKQKALQWLFMLFMPSEFVDVLSLAHLAATQMWNRTPPTPALPTQILSNWFIAYKTTSDNPVSLDGKMVLGSTTRAFRSPVDGVAIRRYDRETGVRYPDSYILVPAWCTTDPFAPTRSHQDTARYFTESLPPKKSAAQSFLVMLPSRTRGNEGIATKNKKPDWLNYEEYQMFAAMRAYPRLQMRQLLIAMVDDLLPFGDDGVQVLVRQLLYHVGDNCWKQDLDSAFYGQIASELVRKADLLKESPNNIGKLLFFGFVGAFFGQYSDSCIECSRLYMSVSRKLGDAVDAQIFLAEKIIPKLYWKQAQLYGCALLSHCPRDNDKGTLLQLVELIVLFQYKSLFAAEDRHASQLQHALHYAMSGNIDAILKAVTANLDCLTRCLRLVIDDLPDRLTWTRICYPDVASTACFEAQAGHHYSVNVLNGIVLVDGVPPGFLPATIVANSLYQRTFGSRNFECIVVDVDHFRTSRLIDDCFLYEFVWQENHLDIIEYDTRDDVGSEPKSSALLSKCVVAISAAARQGQNWGPPQASTGNNPSTQLLRDGLVLVPREKFDIPVLLSKPYSHWYSRRYDAFVIRSPSYKERSILFVITNEALYCVPTEDMAASLDSIIRKLQIYDRLLFRKPKIIEVLSRVEFSKFILPWLDSSLKSIRYEMRRLGLHFLEKEGAVDSVNFCGFSLMQNQTLEGTLMGVTSYLVLSDVLGNEKVLIPAGLIANGGNVIGRSAWNYKGSFHAYDVHSRFRHLIAMDSLGWLQLACMCAASGCLIAEERSMKTGYEMAIGLARHSWTNHELSQAETAKLQEVSKFSNLSCTLRLMCSWIWNCSNRLGLLREEASADAAAGDVAPLGLEVDPLAVREYRESPHAPRLLPTEECFLLGTKQALEYPPTWNSLAENETHHFVAEKEALLAATCLAPQRSKSERAPFPLAIPDGDSGVEREFYEGLKSSWDDHCSVPRFEARRKPTMWRETLDDVRTARQSKEGMILETLRKHESKEFRVAVLSGCIRLAGPYDFLRLVLDANSVAEVNPVLSAETRAEMRTQIVEWMMLCVLEDKLYRIINSSSDNDILEELRAIRNWNPWDHLPWLVFEVEQRLQIRQYQYDVVKRLTDNPHTTIQLNMGLGKTSVLVPMLILEYVNSGECVVRINMLPSLVTVVEQIYKRSLTASAQHVRIMTFPFQRTFPLAEVHSKLLSEEITRCKVGRGCLLVTAQHRNSLLLKQHDSGMFVEGLREESLDVIDESDAILHQSFQLVYALGEQEPLPDGHARWSMAEAFLQILSESTCPYIASVRDDPSLVHSEGPGHGAFRGLRLLPAVKEHQQSLGRALCKELVKSPPHEFLWMKSVPVAELEPLIDIMSNDQCPAKDLIEADLHLLKHKADILAARGSIAFGLLFHCLKARHRVHYGTETSRGKLAVPFSASDTPKARSDYSHPDVQIIYTCLSYFHRGLTREQLREALICLQELGPTAQDTIYSSWINSIRGGSVNRNEMIKFDSIRKVDLYNSDQLELMYQALWKSMKVASFWMNNFVFPQETHIFPQRRVTSAWDLVTGSSEHNAMGFSGTEDNRKLLPLSVRQIEHDLPELRATNGAMIDRILKCTSHVVLLPDDRGDLWKSVLQKCVEMRVDALIDVGGLMAGIKNADAAVFLSGIIDQQQMRGVVYFSTTSDAWSVYSLQSKVHCPLQTSSLTAAECFAFYDESRCRGSDLKLAIKACALVTLEPGLTKDRFLQACARMRKLETGEQSLILAGTSETLGTLSTVEDVLRLTIKNSAKAIEKGIMELYDRGINHYKFPEPQEMDVSLVALYGDAVKKFQSMGSYLDATIESVDDFSEDVEILDKYCRNIGDKANVKASQLAEECERELEEEEEEEEEEEREVEVMSPCSEIDWDFSSAFSGRPLGTELFKVRDDVDLDINWSCKLLCTRNYLRTVTIGSSRKFYLRPVNAFLRFPDGRIVLISDYEAENLLPHWWQVQHSSPEVKLGHLALASRKIWLGGDEMMLRNNVFTMTSAKVFRGYVNFEEDEQKVLGKLFVKGKARSSIAMLLELRHRIRFLERSDLDEFALLAGDGVATGEDTFNQSMDAV
ncbi:Protein of unknown function (DUF3645) [Seminavis robusta]|uniref:ubiquitinyl hydrolase 1 n=1 Tax=Seminavis robusta TaxID=568900 RepID=A0A9N8ECT1_9STRA|nr:Protein of unknown function (DUF3645) [Seminavis robusta]|eukprot:Sro986_g228070.1 Protein of unknown function (DUF3645) (2713) ;mRNA; f:2774-11066